MDLSESIGGMNRAISTVNSSAHNISQLLTNKNIDLSSELVKQIEGENTLKANVKVIKTSDEMMGTLLDMVG